jgi:hypothetical protein
MARVSITLCWDWLPIRVGSCGSLLLQNPLPQRTMGRSARQVSRFRKPQESSLCRSCPRNKQSNFRNRVLQTARLRRGCLDEQGAGDGRFQVPPTRGLSGQLSRRGSSRNSPRFKLLNKRCSWWQFFTCHLSWERSSWRSSGTEAPCHKTRIPKFVCANPELAAGRRSFMPMISVNL